MEKQYNIDKEIRLYNLLLRTYSKHQMTERNYEELLQILKNQLRKDADKLQFERLYAILNKFYEKNQEAFNNGTYQKFDKLYKESILGDNKRKYDMSSLIDEDLVLSQNGKRLYRYNKLDKYPEPMQYVDSLGRKIQIQRLGILNFVEPNGVEDYVENYNVLIKQDGQVCSYDVFSNINIYDMSTNKEYQMAVLDELLSKNNITLSNSNGYIGKIEQNNSPDKDKAEKEKKTKYDYTYTINDDYQLAYDATAASAVAIYARENDKRKTDEEQLLNEDNRKNDEGDR